MRAKGSATLAVIVLAVAASLTACDSKLLANETDTTKASTSNARCDAPGVGSGLRDALCAGDSSKIREALFRVDAMPGEAASDRLLAVLKRLWEDDRSYGTGLPWPALQSVQSRAVFADYLAQGVRNGEIEAPLPDMQRFAVDLVHSAQRDVDQLDGLHLLGVTNAENQVPLLRSITLSTKGPAVRRRYAIEALGYICAPEAAAALREAAQAVIGHEAEVKFVQTAQKKRERLSVSWCRDSDK